MLGSDEIEIGVATITYKENGRVKQAMFEPKMKLTAGVELLNQLSKAKPATSETVRNDSELVMSAWFSKMNEIELADREEYKISSEVINCEEFPNGNVKTCSVKFVFKKI